LSVLDNMMKADCLTAQPSVLADILLQKFI
jgi:hypothetical protein